MRTLFHRAWEAVTTFAHEWSDDNAALMAAGVSFYAIFSLAPLLTLVVMIGSRFFGAAPARQQLVSSAGEFLNHRTAVALGRLADNASAAPSTGITVVSAVLLLWSASAVFRHLRAGLDIVMDVPPAHAKGWFRFLIARFIAIAMVIGVIVFLAAVMAVTSLLAAAHELLPEMAIAHVELWRAIDFVVSTALVALLFTVTLKWVPDVDLKWRHPFRGSLAGALIFTAARAGLAAYLAHGSAIRSYGGAASLAVALIAIFVAVTSLFVAAEITELLARNDEEFRRDRQERREQERKPARK